MSHYIVFVVGNDIERLLEPYNEQDTDYYEKVDETERVYSEWNEYLANKKLLNEKSAYEDIESYAERYFGYDVENGKFYCEYNPNSKWDWYTVGGRWSGFITNNEQKEVDSCLKKDIFSFIYIPYAIVTENGEWHSKGEMGWFGLSDDNDSDWENIFSSIYNDIPDDKLITVVDLHI